MLGKAQVIQSPDARGISQVQISALLLGDCRTWAGCLQSLCVSILRMGMTVTLRTLRGISELIQREHA